MLAPLTVVIFFEPAPRMVDEVHVVHTGRTGRHTRQAGEAPVDVLDRVSANLSATRDHVFDQVDPAARTIELVAEQDIGRTGCGAEPAVSTGSQYLLGFRRVGIG